MAPSTRRIEVRWRLAPAAPRGGAVAVRAFAQLRRSLAPRSSAAMQPPTRPLARIQSPASSQAVQNSASCSVSISASRRAGNNLTRRSSGRLRRRLAKTLGCCSWLRQRAAFKFVSGLRRQHGAAAQWRFRALARSRRFLASRLLGAMRAPTRQRVRMQTRAPVMSIRNSTSGLLANSAMRRVGNNLTRRSSGRAFGTPLS